MSNYIIIVITEYDRRKLGMASWCTSSNVIRNMITIEIREESTAIAIALNIQHNDKPLQKKLNPLMHVRTSDIDVRDR